MQLDVHGHVPWTLKMKVTPSLRTRQVGDLPLVEFLRDDWYPGASSLALEYKTLLQMTCVKLAEACPSIIQA
jgi:hypothetical protein